jgi:hypothetical protein
MYRGPAIRRHQASVWWNHHPMASTRWCFDDADFHVGRENVTAPTGDPTSPYPQVLGLLVYRTGMSLISCSCNVCSSQGHTAFWCHECLCMVFLLIDEINTCLASKEQDNSTRTYNARTCRQRAILDLENSYVPMYAYSCDEPASYKSLRLTTCNPRTASWYSITCPWRVI